MQALFDVASPASFFSKAGRPLTGATLAEGTALMLAQTFTSTFVCGPLPAGKRSFPACRLRRHADYQCVYKNARKQSSASMSYFYRVRDSGAPELAMPRIGLTAGRVLGDAVTRNRIKRRMREAVRAHLDLLPDEVDVVLHPRKFVGEMDFARLSDEVAAIFSKVAKAVRAARGATA